MLKDIVAVKPLEEYKLYLRFEDGIEGLVDVSQLIEFSGIFAPLKDVSYFNQVQLNSELGTIVWPNEADLDPDVLYATIKGEAIPNYEQKTEIIR
ncbi:MAG: DUF2442 domain-containing protein [Phormidium sp.]